jgi:hypothetical protein
MLRFYFPFFSPLPPARGEGAKPWRCRQPGTQRRVQAEGRREGPYRQQ